MAAVRGKRKQAQATLEQFFQPVAKRGDKKPARQQVPMPGRLVALGWFVITGSFLGQCARNGVVLLLANAQCNHYLLLAAAAAASVASSGGRRALLLR